MVEAPANADETAISAALFLFLICLSLCLLALYFMRKHGVGAVPEAALFIFTGWLISFAFHWLGSPVHQSTIDQYLEFRSDFFFLCLMPIIVFESGFNMEKARFFSNVRGISILAFLGTFLTAIVTGVLLWLCTFLLPFPPLSLGECLIFGSVISATDVVAVLNTFRKYHVDPDLYSLVFGESVLNDAVAIIFFRSLLHFRQQDFTFFSVLSSLFLFLSNFVGSLSIGILIGGVASLTSKYFRMDSPDFEDIERSLLIVVPFLSYMLAECLQMSGIVSILFCGLMVSTYNQYNISLDRYPCVSRLHRTLLHASTYYFFSQALHIASSLSEALVFVIFGFSLHSFPALASQFHASTILISCLAIFLSRFIACYPLCSLVNWRNPAPLDGHAKFILLFSGLRGSMAYALSLSTAADKSFGVISDLFVTLTAAYVLFSIFFKGSVVGPLLRRWGMTDYQSISDEYPTETNCEPGWNQLLAHGCSWNYLNEAYFRPFLVRDASAHAEFLSPFASGDHQNQ